jgi:hypothetical protein
MQNLTVTYNTFVQVVSKSPSYYIPQGDGGYELIVVTEEYLISCTILGIETDNKNNFETTYKSLCVMTDSTDDALVLGNIANNIPWVTPRSDDGLIRSSSEKNRQTKTTLYSPNWTDPTTWYGASVFVNEELAVDSGDHVTYNLNNDNIIDAYHAKITNEDSLYDSIGRSYRVVVKVNSILQTEQDPHYGTGGDFIVDYKLGKITFTRTLLDTDVVLVSYFHATSSLFIIKPVGNQKISIDTVEVQFSEDIIITDSITFDIFGLVDVFAPQLVQQNIVPSGTKISLNHKITYKSIMDYMNDSLRSYVSYPAIGGTGWRGCNQKILVLDWDYIAAIVLDGAAGMELRIKLDHEVPFGGTYGTATFYCILEG